MSDPYMQPASCEKWIRFAGLDELDIAKTFGCGQCFRWICNEDGVYTGVAYGRTAQVRCEGRDVWINAPAADIDEIWRDYFDIDRDYTQIRQKLDISDFMRKSSTFGAGIRILRQEPWETLCSFIISQNNNISRIKGIIDRLCCMFGEPVVLPGKPLYAFPSSSRLACCSEADLAPLRCGYRAGYIIDAAISVSGGMIDFGALSALPIDEAKSKLKQIRGVGDKVADCVLLFGLHNLNAFPVDVWVRRALREHFESGFDPAVFSPYAGIAQQYMFHYLRNVEKYSPQ